ncbi:MAG: hypothetical protein N2746_02625 [Deltaproteobacteria bacterium]|nr:hypothetical protein [Deltaproteobacteria bacterium]
MGLKNDKYNKDNKIVLKSGSDDMRAFYDFCIDYLSEENLKDLELYCPAELLSWCEDPEMVKMAIISIRNNNKYRKP